MWYLSLYAKSKLNHQLSPFLWKLTRYKYMTHQIKKNICGTFCLFLWLFSLSILRLHPPPPFSSNASPSEGTPVLGNIGCTPQSLPKFQHPSHELLKENGFTQHVYHKYRRRCLNGTDMSTSSSVDHLFLIWINTVSVHLSFVSKLNLSPLSTNHRAEAAGNRPIPGDEHTVPLLVVFPARSLQQEDVRGVQTAGGRGREGRIQVRALNRCLHSHMLVCISASFKSISHPSIFVFSVL